MKKILSCFVLLVASLGLFLLVGCGKKYEYTDGMHEAINKKYLTWVKEGNAKDGYYANLLGINENDDSFWEKYKGVIYIPADIDGLPVRKISSMFLFNSVVPLKDLKFTEGLDYAMDGKDFKREELKYVEKIYFPQMELIKPFCIEGRIAKSITTIVCPRSAEYGILDFDKIPSNVEVCIPDGVRKIAKINNLSREEIVLPDTLEEIGEINFNCKKLVLNGHLKKIGKLNSLSACELCLPSTLKRIDEIEGKYKELVFDYSVQIGSISKVKCKKIVFSGEAWGIPKLSHCECDLIDFSSVSYIPHLEYIHCNDIIFSGKFEELGGMECCHAKKVIFNSGKKIGNFYKVECKEIVMPESLQEFKGMNECEIGHLLFKGGEKIGDIKLCDIGVVVFPASLREYGNIDYAVNELEFKGGEKIGNIDLSSNSFSHKIVFPDTLQELGKIRARCNHLVFPQKLQKIGVVSMGNFSQTGCKEAIFPESLQEIGTLSGWIDKPVFNGVVKIGKIDHFKCKEVVFPKSLQVVDEINTCDFGKLEFKGLVKIGRIIRISSYEEEECKEIIFPETLQELGEMKDISVNKIKFEGGVKIGIVSGIHCHHRYNGDYCEEIIFPKTLKELEEISNVRVDRIEFRGGQKIGKIDLGDGNICDEIVFPETMQELGEIKGKFKKIQFKNISGRVGKFDVSGMEEARLPNEIGEDGKLDIVQLFEKNPQLRKLEYNGVYVYSLYGELKETKNLDDFFVDLGNRYIANESWDQYESLKILKENFILNGQKVAVQYHFPTVRELKKGKQK